jgi:hypothetical protein
MFFRSAGVMLLVALMTTGCDRLSGAADRKITDAEAVGYACRVSLKKPEDCMKENDTQSTTSVLVGWKAADKDIQDKTLDPSMGQDKLAAARAAAAASATEAASTADKGDEKSPEHKPNKSP